MTFTPHYINAHQQEVERKRKEQRINFALRNQPNNSSSIAKDSVTFQQNHYSSMEDALKQVRKGSVTHEDTTQVVRPESKGLHR